MSTRKPHLRCANCATLTKEVNHLGAQLYRARDIAATAYNRAYLLDKNPKVQALARMMLEALANE